MYEIKDADGKVIACAGEIIGPVVITLDRRYEHNPKDIEKLDVAIRTELSDFLHPNHPIIFE